MAMMLARSFFCLIICALFVSLCQADDAGPKTALPPVSLPGRLAQLGDTIPATASPAPLEASDVPPFHLTRVALSGEVLGDRVSLQATVDLTVNRGEQWHEIPLRLGQAHIWRHAYTGTGAESPGVSAKGMEEGLVWKVRGLGRHQLVFDMWVPIKRIPGGGQLQLSLPPLPAQFEASLKLQIPQAPVIVRTPKETTLLSQEEEDGATTIEASVGGSRLDVSWHPAVAPRGSLAQVRNLWTITPQAEQLLMVVDQTLQFDLGSVNNFTVRLPDGCRLVEIAGPLVKNHRSDPARPGWEIVELDARTADRAEIRWQFTRELPEDEGPVLLNGLDVEGASKQTGQLRFERYPGLRLFPDMERSRFVQRLEIPASPMAGSALPPPSLLYEYSRQPFQLAIHPVAAEPVTTVRPIYELRVQEDRLRLHTVFEVHVEAGSIQQLPVQWQAAAGQWKETSWDDVEDITDPQNMLPLHRSWESPRTGRFVIGFRSTLPVNLKDSEPLSINLPLPEATHLLPALLVIDSLDHVEVVLPEGDSAATRLGPEAISELSNTELPSGNVFRLKRGAAQLVMGFQLHSRTVTTNTLIEPSADSTSALRVHQRTLLDIQYGRLSSFGVMLPKELLALNPSYAAAETIRVTINGQQVPLVPVSSGWRIAAPRPLSGETLVDFDYSIPLSSDPTVSEDVVDVPVIQIEEADLTELRCQVGEIDRVQVRDDQNWGAVRTSPDGALWVARDAAASTLPLVVSRQLADASQQYTVERAYVRTRFAENGLSESYAVYQLLSPPKRIVLQLPQGTLPEDVREIRLNDEVMPPTAISLSAASELRITLPEGPFETAQLAILFRERSNQSFGLSNVQVLEFPRFPASVWVNETDWEFQLPFGQHLFTYPQTLTPLFQWKPRGLFWSRTLTPEYISERTEWQQADDPEGMNFAATQSYAFRGIGQVTQVHIRAMSRSLILLIGAGTTLALGFMFWQLPQTRNVFSLVLLGFAFSVASLWFLEPMQLLLQPALLGLAFAALATFFEGRRKRTDAKLTSTRIAPPGSSAVMSAHGSSVPPPPSSPDSATRIPSTIYRPGP
ncbi:MAG: hypothetical protein KDA90_07180 [Planctomycetaceae bacterium]|nr:hypothetical protein [Planctomycetaceae bacterium]